MKRIISLLIVMLMACSAVVFAAGTPEISLKAMIPGNIMATATFVGPPPLPIGILIGFRKTEADFEKVLIRVPEKLQEPIRLQAEMTKAILKAPGDEDGEEPTGILPEEEPPGEEPTPRPPTPKRPIPKVPPAGEDNGELGPPWTIEKCDQLLGGHPFEGYTDLPNSCATGGPVTAPLTQCTYCNPQKTSTGDPEICVDANGLITATSGCVAPGATIIITNQNTQEQLILTANAQGGFQIQSQTAQPGHIISATLARIPSTPPVVDI
ncbi:MAG: hypothetical protein KAT43_03660 [Nanoarchaeota archaeon]|nr:hypothetical protein [Nanoarchaeota archaeon]